MTKEQIEIYEYCKKHIEDVEACKLPFNSQKYGCSSGRPSIEYDLENIHKEMWSKVFNAMGDAKEKIRNIIKEL